MASATTVNEVQAIKTLNNLNMEGKFVESSLRQFTNLNTATIIYGDGIKDVTSGSTVTLYDAITKQNIGYVLRILQGGLNGTNEYLRQGTADATAQKLVDSINSYHVPNNNKYSAIIEYFADLNNATANDTITLYNYETAVVFTMVTNTPATPSAIAVQFEKVNSDVDATATNLATAINNHSAFSAILDITKQIIIITQTSSSGKPTDNTTNFEDGDTNTELKLTNFSNFSATINKNNKTITVIQNSSKSYNSNPTPSGFTPEELSVTNFKVNSGDEAAISSETIGTYQILNKVITDLSTLKKKITDRNKILQKDLSNDVDDVDHVTLSSSDKTATHQSNITADKSRGNLNETNGSNHEKPSVFTATDSSTIFYSEDALFTLLKGLGYEIFKFKNGITGSNNGVGSAYAGLSEIPISISPQTPHTSGIATLPNIAATIHNINRSGTINTTENTSAGSIPEGTSNTDDGVGLIQLINTIINNITLIKKSIKTRELLILEALKTSNFSNPTIDVANYHSKVPTLKTRGDLLDDTGGTDETTHNFHKPSIFNSSESYRYSEDAVFGLFSCISYELMKLLNFTNASNNGGHIEHAGLASIPISIELIN